MQRTWAATAARIRANRATTPAEYKRALQEYYSLLQENVTRLNERREGVPPTPTAVNPPWVVDPDTVIPD